MAQLTVISHGAAAAIVLPEELLHSIGLHVGDTLEATVEDRQLILRPADDAARQRLVAEVTEEVLTRRSDAYQRLA